MDVPVLLDQYERTYNSSVQKQNAFNRACWEQWTIGTDGKRESEKSLLAARLDDDDDDDMSAVLIHPFSA